MPKKNTLSSRDTSPQTLEKANNYFNEMSISLNQALNELKKNQSLVQTEVMNIVHTVDEICNQINSIKLSVMDIKNEGKQAAEVNVLARSLHDIERSVSFSQMTGTSKAIEEINDIKKDIVRLSNLKTTNREKFIGALFSSASVLSKAFSSGSTLLTKKDNFLGKPSTVNKPTSREEAIASTVSKPAVPVVDPTRPPAPSTPPPPRPAGPPPVNPAVYMHRFKNQMPKAEVEADAEKKSDLTK